jgi:hypothetical protein
LAPVMSAIFVYAAIPPTVDQESMQVDYVHVYRP